VHKKVTYKNESTKIRKMSVIPPRPRLFIVPKTFNIKGAINNTDAAPGDWFYLPPFYYYHADWDNTTDWQQGGYSIVRSPTIRCLDVRFGTDFRGAPVADATAYYSGILNDPRGSVIDIVVTPEDIGVRQRLFRTSKLIGFMEEVWLRYSGGRLCNVALNSASSRIHISQTSIEAADNAGDLSRHLDCHFEEHQKSIPNGDPNNQHMYVGQVLALAPLKLSVYVILWILDYVSVYYRSAMSASFKRNLIDCVMSSYQRIEKRK
jgi:hypothetical protein